MNPVLLAAISVGIIGLICAVMLAVASKVIAVKEDETFLRLRECLPGANCGACGYAGCDGYAHALREGGVKPNLCVPGGDTAATKISQLLGVEFEDVVEQVAFVRCNGDCNNTSDKMEYHGIQSCKAAKLFFGGSGKCTYGCLGLGDCASVCPNDAICIKDGLARVNPRLCVGCGLCAKECPNGLIAVLPDTVKVIVRCRNTDKGGATRQECSVGCIGCKKCEKECPAGAITVNTNLAFVDYTKCTNCGHCQEVCPSGCIFIGDFSGAHKAK